MDSSSQPKGISDNDEMIDLVTDMLARHWRKGKIKAAVRQAAYDKGLIKDPRTDAENGEGLSTQTINALVARARKVMLNNIKRSKDDLRAQSFAVYAGIVERQSSKDDRVASLAQTRIDKVMGLEPQLNDGVDDDLDALRDSLDIPLGGAGAPPEETE